MAFRENGKFITNLCFSATNNWRWHDRTTSYLPSHVIYLCITPTSSLYGSLRMMGFSPFPFLSSYSLGYKKDSIASLSILYFPIHCMPSLGRPVTSTIVSSVTGICISWITKTPLCKLWKNASVIFVSYPCNLLKYFVHPKRCKISLAWLVTCNNVGSRRTLQPPMSCVNSWGHLSFLSTT